MATIQPKPILGGAGVWAVVDGICITLLPMKQLSLSDWQAYLSETKALVEADHVVVTATISYLGFDVSAQHRKMAADSLTDSTRNGTHILLTDSVLMRGALRAFVWIMPSVKISAYAPTEWRKASKWLQACAPHDEEMLGTTLAAAFAKAGINPSLQKSA